MRTTRAKTAIIARILSIRKRNGFCLPRLFTVDKYSTDFLETSQRIRRGYQGTKPRGAPALPIIRAPLSGLDPLSAGEDKEAHDVQGDGGEKETDHQQILNEERGAPQEIQSLNRTARKDKGRHGVEAYYPRNLFAANPSS